MNPAADFLHPTMHLPDDVVHVIDHTRRTSALLAVRNAQAGAPERLLPEAEK